MSVATKSAVGIGVGAMMAGGVWYLLRSQDRAALVDLLTNDTKIPIVQALAGFVKPPASLKLIAAGEFDAFAEEKILYTETTTPQEVYSKVNKDVQKYIGDIPQDALESIFKSIGLDESTLKKLKAAVDFFRGFGSKQRPS